MLEHEWRCAEAPGWAGVFKARICHEQTWGGHIYPHFVAGTAGERTAGGYWLGAQERGKMAQLLWGVTLARPGGSDMCWGLYNLVLHGDR